MSLESNTKSVTAETVFRILLVWLGWLYKDPHKRSPRRDISPTVELRDQITHHYTGETPHILNLYHKLDLIRNHLSENRYNRQGACLASQRCKFNPSIVYDSQNTSGMIPELRTRSGPSAVLECTPSPQKEIIEVNPSSNSDLKDYKNQLWEVPTY